MHASVRNGDRHEHIAGFGDGIIVGNTELEIDEPGRQPRIVDQALVPELAIRDELENAIPGVDLRRENANLVERASDNARLNVVTNFEGPMPEQHYSSGNIGKCTL